jgi:hypothetical protein
MEPGELEKNRSPVQPGRRAGPSGRLLKSEISNLKFEIPKGAHPMANDNGEQANLRGDSITLTEGTLFVPRLMSPGNVEMVSKLCSSMADLRAQMGKLEGTLVGYRRELSEQRSEISKLKRRVQEFSEQPARAGAA